MKFYVLTCWLLFAGAFVACNSTSNQPQPRGFLLKNATLVDGTGNYPKENTEILIIGDTIAAIGQNLDSEQAAGIIDLEGKMVLPALIAAHVHIGNLKGTTTKADNYTRENILRQLQQYQDYGVLNILAMGTDRPYLFESGLRDSSANGLLPGARIHTAGYGFGVPQGAPPMQFAMDRVFRPTDVAQIPGQMDSLSKLRPDAVKIWVDDFGGQFEKMKPEIYQSVITEAHKRNLRVAAHVYYLSDLKLLVGAGVDIIAHSVRDQIIDDTTLAAMKTKGVAYIPTLSLDEFAYIYAEKPEWLNDPFFKKSLEPGVYEMITSGKYQQDLKNSPALAKNMTAFETALKNCKRVYEAGVLVAMGTDSGAMALHAQGFSEHLELDLMVQAGLSPLQAITIATSNAAKLLRIDDLYGSIAPGKKADLLIVSGNAVNDIKDSRKIAAIYKDGKEVSKGPLE